jgi:TrmH family RNA methyltransferase
VSDPVLSLRNGHVKAARRLSRRSARTELGLFLAEGRQAVAEALDVPGCVTEVFAERDRHHDLRDRAAGLPWRLVDAPAMAALSGTVTPQGIVAVCRRVDLPLADVLAQEPRLVAVCADVRDPGNAGAVIRCADAAGAGAVVLTGDSVDVYNGKAVRASVGSLFHLPVAVCRDAGETVDDLRRSGLTVVAADASGEVDLDEAADTGLLARRTAWIFGNEAWGLPADLQTAADHRVRIPIHGRAESLNLATAAAVCLYASARALR